MFNAKDVITDAVNRATGAMAAYKRGDVVAWQLIESLAGFARYTQHWPAFMRRVKRDVRRGRGITLVAVNGVGLKLETANEQLHDRSIRRHRRACRQMRMDIVELQALPDRELTVHERTAKHRKIDQAKHGRRAVLYSLRLGHTLAKPSSTGIPRVRPASTTTK